MHKRTLNSRFFFLFFAVIGLIFTACFAPAQNPAVLNPTQPDASQPDSSRPWMNPNLSPEERADLVLKQLTLEEKIALLHGNGMAHAPNWQMPLTQSHQRRRRLC